MRVSPLFLALLIQLGVTALSSAQEPAEEPAAGEPAALINPNPLSGLSLESLSATRMLPLFTPSRTAPAIPEEQIEPEVVEVEPMVEPDQPPPALTLVGIVLTSTTKTALLLDPGSNQVHRLAPGDEYEGWSLSIVDARSIELRSGERVEGLKMFESFPAPPNVGMGQFPEEFPVDITEPDMQGQPGFPPPETPVDEVYQEALPPEQPIDDVYQEAPAPELPLDGISQEAPADSQPSADFDPALGEMPLPEEGPLPAEGDADPG